ncbi:MAG: pilus assembly protein [Candidatus Dormibacteraeota bacterium]|nr:pilus assembly protein [Candidatus Dormibacteraeota bacterium]
MTCEAVGSLRASDFTPGRGEGMARQHQRGQALVETAIVLPLLFLLFLGFLLVMVTAQAYVDVDTATSLAAASAVTAPANDNAKSREFALQTYNGTLHQSTYLQPQALAGCGGYSAGGSVTCTGKATLYLSRTPMAVLAFWNPHWTITIQATSTAYSSPYRSV